MGRKESEPHVAGGNYHGTEDHVGLENFGLGLIDMRRHRDARYR